MVESSDFLTSERPTRLRVDNLNTLLVQLVRDGRADEAREVVRSLPIKQRAKERLGVRLTPGPTFEKSRYDD